MTGDNIKQLRIKKGITQKQLAEKTGLAAITIRQYESGKREPKTESLKRIALVLECDISELIDVFAANFDSKNVQKTTEEWKPVFDRLGYKIVQSYADEKDAFVTFELKKDGITKTVSTPALSEIKRQTEESIFSIQRDLIDSKTAVLLESIKPD
ncbi:MAG: helix-turn-helix domain-containing protein [Lachnospiraceae bacterium]|nr:helix-turn-helix domain-containing protein [Lachnospiraceae bacterium]